MTNPLTLTPYFFPPSPSGTTPAESSETQALITALHMQPHIEGGYYVETDRDPTLVRSPFPDEPPTPPNEPTTTPSPPLTPHRKGFAPSHRNASTTIFYFLTTARPQGAFHRNRARTIHTLHRGRGRYVLIHADEEGGGQGRIESFVVGPDVGRGERLQWVVEGNVFKASFLLPDEEGCDTSEGLLISETVVPGFEFCDHDFLTLGGLRALLGKEAAEGLEWLVRKDGGDVLVE